MLFDRTGARIRPRIRARKFKRALFCPALLLIPLVCPAAAPSAADLAAALKNISIDPDQTYRVRELQFSRGDVNIYLTEGVLAFTTPVAGRTVAAVFTTQGVEAGDAEVLALPAQRSERASLAAFTKSPNLDEHFSSAVFVFSDDTAQELLSQIQQRPIHKASDIAAQHSPALNSVVRQAVPEIAVRMVQSLIDNHTPEQGFFYALIAGRELGGFDIFYEPREFEPVTIGRPYTTPTGALKFQLWTAFRPRHAARIEPSLAGIHDYRIDATIHPDLTMSVAADFTYAANANSGRALVFSLSDRLKVTSATLDGNPIEVFQPDNSAPIEGRENGRTFLLAATAPLDSAGTHKVEIRYEGSVVRQTGNGGYFVDDRNLWYPYVLPMLTTFDLTFHFPSSLNLVSTGELVSDKTDGDIRTVHRRTPVAEALAGFNLGDYQLTVDEKGQYRVECYANRPAGAETQAIAEETEHLLDYYTRRWLPIPIHSVAVTPIGAPLGQGFPGMIYLSTVAYIPRESRPAELRNPRLDTFADILLPHEVAHQWWGNIVVPADYRAGWFAEAMANYSALQYLDSAKGADARSQTTKELANFSGSALHSAPVLRVLFDTQQQPSPLPAILDRYRADLMTERDGKPIDAAGPVDFGIRLLDARGPTVWQTIVYEKGTWILHMLRQRLGDEGFRKMQLRLLQDFAAKPLTNEDFRKAASEFVPPGQPDRSLSAFFDAWVYGTGIPKMSIVATSDGPAIQVSGVADDFAADVPLDCRSRQGKEQTHWVRVSSGSNAIDIPGCRLPSRQNYLYTQ